MLQITNSKAEHLSRNMNIYTLFGYKLCALHLHSIKCGKTVIAKIGIPNDQYHEDLKSKSVQGFEVILSRFTNRGVKPVAVNKRSAF